MSNKPFPKKYLGDYNTTQESYSVYVQDDTIEVPAAKMELKLAYNELWLSTPGQIIKATYTVKAETKQYYTFLVELDNGIIEEWQLHPRGKKIVRKAIAPRPESIFLKK
ncbi:MAG: hypothetical protein R3277_12575 [Brumimicrobium sp.]|nr:hypothetical protein [Brumimicrobium sp.]